MGNNSFAPFSSNPETFVVQNITKPPKTIRIFNAPINFNGTRDLLKLEGIGEGDIRASLLKGELRNRILAKDIVILSSDIDLLQFNSIHKSFLQSAGINGGLQINTAQSAVKRIEDVQLVGTVDDVNTMFFIPTGKFIFSTDYKIIVYRNGVKQLFLDDYLIAESAGPGTGFDTVIFIIPPNAMPPPDVITADYYILNS